MPSPTYQQRVDRNDDRSAMLDKVYRARLRLADLENACAGGEAQIRAAQSRLDSIPAYERGWIVEVIALLALVAVALEWYPARMMSQVFFFASAGELVALTAAFAIGGFLLGLLLGELLRRHRTPQAHAALDWVFLAFAATAVGAFLLVGYELRLAYARASIDAAQSPMEPAVQAAALTTLAFIGIVIAFTSGYYRESVEAMRVRWRLGGLHGRVRRNQKHLELTRAELEAAERAYRLHAESETAAAARAGYTSERYDGDAPGAAGSSGPSANGVSKGAGEI
ncbi:MAG TPA: hypothetical protein VE826_12870 [Dongiaceae bacterium]|nr:hypothetical protein [Dongiaceae bacterium]